jgi:hypothetical protein
MCTNERACLQWQAGGSPGIAGRTNGGDGVAYGVRATIVRFKQDAAGDWIAELSCGHSQHMRHRPPWMLRPWVTTEAGRALKLGSELDCPLCDQRTEDQKV